MKMRRNGDIQWKYVFLSGFNYFFMIFSSRIIQQNHLSMTQEYIDKVFSGLYFILKLYSVFSGANPEF